MSNTTMSMEELRNQLATKEAQFLSLQIEKNFLERALSDFNFHHNAHDGILFTDMEHRVVYANPYFLEMMQIDDPQEILNKPLSAKVWVNPEESQKLFTDIHENGFVRERELHLLNKNGEPVFAMCSSVISKDNEGQPIGTEMMFCNVTSKRKIQGELMERQRDLERVTEFCRGTLETLLDSVQRGADPKELTGMLKRMQNELSKVTSAE